MSPALIDNRTPTISPQMQPKRSSLRNPNPKGQISSSSFFFDFSGFPSSNLSFEHQQQRRSSQTDSETMNTWNPVQGASAIRQTNDGSFEHSFASPSVPLAGFEKPIMGRSKPRLVKVRKNFVSHQGRSTPHSESGVETGFNPFRPVSESSDDIRMHEMHDQWTSWNPFTSNSAQKSKGSTSSGSSVSDDFKFGKSENADFVFGANQSSSVSNLNSETSGFGGSAGELLPDEMRKLNIGSGTEYRSAKDAAFSTGERVGVNSGDVSGKDAFVFGSSSKSKLGLDGSAVSKLPDEMRKLNIESSGNADSVEKTKDSDLSTKANDKNTSVFGSSDNVTSAFGRNTASKILDEMKKLNVEDSRNVGGVEKTKDAKVSSKANYTNTSVSGSSKNTDGSMSGSSTTTLPDEMKKLNIEEGSGNGDGVEKHADFQPNEKNTFVFGSNKSTDGVEMTKDAKFSSKANDKNTFVSGSSKNTAGSLGGRSTTTLPDAMKKLNIEGSGNGDGVEKHADFQPNENTFVFGSNKNTDGVEMTKDAKLSSKANDKKTFVSGSSKNTDGSLGGSSTTTLLDEMKKLNIEGSGNGDGVEKHADFQPNEKNTFVFGINKNSAGSFGGSTVNMLPDEMQKLNIGSRIGDSGSRPDTDVSFSRIFVKDNQLGNSTDKIFHDPAVGSSIPTPFTFHDPAVGSSIPIPFTFQGGVQGKNLGVGSVPLVHPNDESKLNETYGSSSSFSSGGPGFQSVGNVFEVPNTDRAEEKAGFSFTSTRDGLGTPHMDLRMPKQDASCSSTGNLFAGLNQKLDFSANKGAVKRLKKRKGKLKQPAPSHQWAGQNYVSTEKSSVENPESPGCYSPMDFSPYQETLAADQCSRETSLASEESFHLDTNSASTNAHRSVSIDATDEDLVTGGQSLDINEDDSKCGELNEEGSRYHFEGSVSAECPFEEFVSGADIECLRFKTKKVDPGSNVSVAATETEAGFCSNIERQASDGRTKFCFASSSEDVSGSNFTFAASTFATSTFAASTSPQGHLSVSKRHYRKKNRMKVGQDALGSSSNAKIQLASPSVEFFPLASSSSHLGFGHDKKGDSSISQSKGENRFEADKELGIKQGSISAAAATAAAQEACEKWRVRGNQAYANGNLSKAEDYYTRGVNCVSPTETSKSCLRALALCYSNRAATRMSLGRMREALGDCTMAVAIDPNFLRVQVRAANCHLALGEIEDALKYFKKCLQSGGDVCLDQKIVIEASDGLKKAQQVTEYIDRCAELLQQRTSNDAESAFQIIAEALSISPYSEKLVEMKAEALFMLRKYEEVAQLCEQNLDSAEKSSASIGADGQLENLGGSESINYSTAKLWCWCLISKSYFYLGRLEEALDFLEKLQQVGPAIEKYGSKTLESLSSLAVTMRELLRHKAAGNEAFQSGRHSEAVEHYTAALSCNVESRPFAAICFCNRAAAHQALGQITDAIADCSLAIALDGNYAKAISRSVTLHEMIRDYGKAASDLQRLVSLLEKQTEEKVNQSGKLGRSTGSVNDLRQARLRLSIMEEEAKQGTSLDMYLILGIEPSGMASDIKKAYRKAALRHHPDKAGQFLSRSENGDDGLWKEIAEEVHKDADRLFKMIGEAYTILSDPAKRSRYDLEEEVRNALKKGNGSSTPRTPSDAHNYAFERSGSRRQWREMWKSYGNQHPRWSEASQSNRYS